MKTCSEIRHDNLLQVIEQVGSLQAVADCLGVSNAQVSQLKTRAPYKSGKPRNIGDDTARKIEEGFGLERGWMDHEHPSPPAGTPLALHTPTASPPSWPFSTPYARLHVLNAGDIEAIDTMMQTLVAARERDAAAERIPEKMAAGAY